MCIIIGEILMNFHLLSQKSKLTIIMFHCRIQSINFINKNRLTAYRILEPNINLFLKLDSLDILT